MNLALPLSNYSMRLTREIFFAGKIVIADEENAGELHDKLMEKGAWLIVKTLQQLAAGTLTEQSQQSIVGYKDLKHAPKIFTETCKIDWSKSTSTVFNLIRG